MSNRTVQTFTSWDGVPALQAFYDSAATGDLKTVTNALADSLIGPGAGVLTGTAGAVGPFKLQVEYLHRSNQAVVVIAALTPLANYAGAPLFTMSDTAGGSGVAQFGDANASQCEVFAPNGGQVDFLVSVDDSGSMDDYQQALANTATAMAAQLTNSQIDWRIALVTSSLVANNEPNSNVIRGFTRDIDQFRSWLTQDSTCNNGTCTNVPGASPACWGQGANGGCWVDTDGSGTERVVGSAARALDRLTPATVAEQNNRLRAGANVVVILLGDADDQSGSAGQASTTLASFTAFFTTLNATFSHTVGGNNHTYTNRVGPVTVHGIVCPDGSDCGETQRTPRITAGVITNTGGVRGDVGSGPSIGNAVQQIITSAIGAAGHVMQKPPIGASVKVALEAVQDGALCNKDDLARSRVDGFDFDGINRTLSFFGACRPGDSATRAAVSYRYWIDLTPDPGGQLPCEEDPHFDPNAPGLCEGNLVCNPQSGACECPANCGAAQAPLGRVCDPNPLVCDFVCTSDCGGSCTAFQTCNAAACACECRQSFTCPAGSRFESTGGVCGCVCDATQLGCGATYQVDTDSCACVCRPDCGGCGAGTSCNTSTCQCSSGIN